jgi:hypothetical protein
MAAETLFELTQNGWTVWFCIMGLCTINQVVFVPASRRSQACAMKREIIPTSRIAAPSETNQTHGANRPLHL